LVGSWKSERGYHQQSMVWASAPSKAGKIGCSRRHIWGVRGNSRGHSPNTRDDDFNHFRRWAFGKMQGRSDGC
jgi:hypothetical protein